MKNFISVVIFFSVFGVLSIQTGVWEGLDQGSSTHSSTQSMSSNMDIRKLEFENIELKSEILKLKAKNEHLALTNLSKRNRSRTIASVDGDLVQFDVYQWSDQKLLDIAEQSLHFKKFEKSAQFYNALQVHYPNSKLVNAEVLFNYGVASFESRSHYDWAENSFQKIVQDFPASKYSRGSKLWLALAYHKSGKTGRFMASVDEFRMKYRNSKEWKVLSRYYEDIAYKFKK